MLKKILLKINFLIIIFLLLFYNTQTFAKDNENIKENINTKENINVKENIEVNENAIITVVLAICSDISTNFANNNPGMQAQFGHHSWIAITNFCKTPIKINGITIKIFETMTIGAWQGGIHNGIFYNVERYYAEKGEFATENSAYKLETLNIFELNYLISIINNTANDTWSLTNNCATFAEKIWNTFASEETKISAGIIKCPLKLYDNILAHGGKKGLILSSKEMDLYYGGKNPTKFNL